MKGLVKLKIYLRIRAIFFVVVKKCPLQRMYKIIPTTGRKTKAKSQANRRPASFLSKKRTKMIKTMFKMFPISVKILKNVILVSLIYKLYLILTKIKRAKFLNIIYFHKCSTYIFQNPCFLKNNSLHYI